MSITLEERHARTDPLYEPMPKRPLGRLGWSASLFTMGGVKWDTMCSDAEAVALVQRALELGVNTFDTAHSYGEGESERKLGLVLEDIRERVWVNTKTIDRTYDGAMRQMEISFKRLKTDYVDLMFVHSVDNEEHYRQIMAPNSVLKAVEEMKTAGRVRHIGVSGHWVRDVQARIIQDFPFEAVLHPAGLFNVAYDYSFLDVVTPVARERGMAVLGMKILGSGRVKRARSIEPYLRYSFSLPIDTAVIGVDSIHQLEEIVRVAKRPLTPVDEREQRSLIPEALEITREWDEGEFNWLQAYSAELRS